MKYAVHISDLMTVPAWHPIHLLLDPFLTQETVQLDNAIFDAYGVLIAERPDRDWLAAAAVAQMHNLPGQGHKIRIYESATGRGGWRKARQEALADAD